MCLLSVVVPCVLSLYALNNWSADTSHQPVRTSCEEIDLSCMPYSSVLGSSKLEGLEGITILVTIDGYQLLYVSVQNSSIFDCKGTLSQSPDLTQELHIL